MDKKKIAVVVAAILVVAGCIVVLYPYFEQLKSFHTGIAQAHDFDAYAQKLRMENKQTLSPKEKKQEGDVDLDRLYQQMKSYNERLYENGQSGLKDAWSYEQSSFALEEWGLKDNIFGYLQIPAMNVTIPIYLGASEENMKLGAVHLSQTSLPIGGANTNSVIAAHRGYYRSAMFRDIDKLKLNDPVYVTNPWQTRRYRVTKIKIIKPTDINEILIEKGKDMLTLITCHPFFVNDHRYVVYCTFDGVVQKKEQKAVARQITPLAMLPTPVKVVGASGGIALIMIVIGLLCMRIVQRKNRLRRHWGNIRSDE